MTIRIKLEQAAEKYRCAVEGMALSEAPLRQRVHEAFVTFDVFREDELPEDVRSDYRAVKARATWDQAKRAEGTIAATLATVSDEEVLAIARLITALSGKLTHAEVLQARGERT